MAKQTKRKSLSKKNPKGMSITRARKEQILVLAGALAQIAPSTTYGDSFSMENLAKEWKLQKYFKKHRNKIIDITFFLENVIRHHPRMPKKLVLEIVKRGSTWKANKGELVTPEMREAIAVPMKNLGFDITMELAALPYITLPSLLSPSFELCSLFEQLSLHPELTSDISELFLEGHYNEAIRKALERFEKSIQDISGLQELSGKDLMTKAFSLSSPPIALNELNGTNDKNEQEGFRFMTMGAMIGLRNIFSHGDAEQFEVSEVVELLCFVSFLFKRVDRRTSP